MNHYWIPRHAPNTYFYIEYHPDQEDAADAPVTACLYEIDHAQH